MDNQELMFQLAGLAINSAMLALQIRQRRAKHSSRKCGGRRPRK